MPSTLPARVAHFIRNCPRPAKPACVCRSVAAIRKLQPGCVVTRDGKVASSSRIKISRQCRGIGMTMRNPAAPPSKPGEATAHALILAAGVGRRLGDEGLNGHSRPKAMLEFGGKSLLRRHVEILR